MRLLLVIAACASVLVFRLTAWNRKVTLDDWRGWVVFAFMMFGGHTIAQIIADLVRAIAK